MTTHPTTSLPHLVLAMLADARLPTGAHAQSAGLEAAVQAGLGVDGIPDFARSRLRTVTETEAGAAVLARHSWLSGEVGGLDAVAAAWAARTPAKPLRDAADRLGRGYARLARNLWPDALAADQLSARGAEPTLRYPRPVVLGVIAAVTGIGPVDLARLVAYDDVQTIAAAALKLLPLDPMTTAGWLLELEPEITRMTDQIAALTHCDDLPAGSAPLLDAYLTAHVHAPRRLFHA